MINGNIPSADSILDAIIGYSLVGAPRGTAAQLIEMANHNEAPILCLDTPSGLDATIGHAFHPHIRASATLTLALPKTGLLTERARPIVGELFLADISVPTSLYEKMGVQVGHLFTEGEIVKIY
jgi:NAD(P)H-hydrate epimerase